MKTEFRAWAIQYKSNRLSKYGMIINTDDETRSSGSLKPRIFMSRAEARRYKTFYINDRYGIHKTSVVPIKVTVETLE